MLENEKGTEGVGERKHTAHSRTGLGNIHHHFLFHVSHCRLGRKHLSSSEEQAVWTLQGYHRLSKSPQCITKKKQGGPLPSTGSVQLARNQQGHFQKPEDKLKYLLLGQPVLVNIRHTRS